MGTFHPFVHGVNYTKVDYCERLMTFLSRMNTKVRTMSCIALLTRSTSQFILRTAIFPLPLRFSEVPFQDPKGIS